MKPAPLEKDIETQVCKYAKSHGWLVYKFSSPNNRGVPDRIFITPKGSTVFVEFKRKGKMPTKLQEHVHETLKNQGCAVWVIDDVQEGKQMVYDYTRP